MSDATCNGAAVMAADLILPQEGAWTADVHADLDTIPARVTLQILGVTYQGTVARGDFVGGLAKLRVVGGAGGLLGTLAPKHYRHSPRLASVVTDILSEASESLAPTSDQSVLQRTLSKWTRVAAPARDQLAQLLAHVGADWRVLADGTVWIGRYAWAAAPAVEAVWMGGDPQDGRQTWAADVATWEPGQTFGGMRIGSVRHLVAKGSSRTILVAAQDSGVRGVVAGELARVGWPFAQTFAGQAVTQDADGTLQVQPDDPTWPAMTGVPIRPGIPCSLKVQGGARVLVTFEGGSPEAPVVTSWGPSTPLEVQIGGSTPVALQGGTVDCGTLYYVITSGAISAISYEPPGSVSVPLGTPIPLTGRITSGASVLKTS